MSPFRLFAPLLALACLACPGTLEDPSRFADAAGDVVTPLDAGGDGSGCPDVPNDIFGKICGTAGCHSDTSPANGLDLKSPDVGTRLAGKCATGGPGYLINPTDPKSSVVYTKLLASPPFGSQMPLVGNKLDDATLACVLTYISAQQGALQSCGGTGDAGGD